MRYGRFVAAFIFVVTLSLMGATSFAESITVSQKVDVQAVVAPMQYIVINQSGQITEIGSNTTQAVEPQVYVGKVAQNNQVGLTRAVYEQYGKLINSQPLHAGILYKRPPPIKVAQVYQIKILDTSSI